MSDSLITVPVSQFVQMLKQKFPQYATVADERLLQAFVQKNPQYRVTYDGTTAVSVSWERPPVTPQVLPTSHTPQNSENREKSEPSQAVHATAPETTTRDSQGNIEEQNTQEQTTPPATENAIENQPNGEETNTKGSEHTTLDTVAASTVADGAKTDAEWKDSSQPKPDEKPIAEDISQSSVEAGVSALPSASVIKPKSVQLRVFAITGIVIAGALLCAALARVAIIRSAKQEQSRQVAAAAVAAEQARRAEAIEAERKKAEELRAAKEQKKAELEETQRQEAAELRRPCEGCVTLKVLDARLVTITTRDGNGYQKSESQPLQRLTVAVGGLLKGDGLNLNGQVFEGHGATADILCLHNCFDLQEGRIYRMSLDRLRTHMRPCYAQYGSCWDYDNLPYFATNRGNGMSAWQILEVCRPGQRCLALSTVNSRE